MIKYKRVKKKKKKKRWSINEGVIMCEWSEWVRWCIYWKNATKRESNWKAKDGGLFCGEVITNLYKSILLQPSTWGKVSWLGNIRTFVRRLRVNFFVWRDRHGFRRRRMRSLEVMLLVARRKEVLALLGSCLLSPPHILMNIRVGTRRSHPTLH